MLKDEQYKAAADYLAKEISRDFLEEVIGEDFGTQSPIEELFLVWFKAHQRANAWCDPFLEDLRLLPQQEIEIRDGKKYRLDFVISTWDGDLVHEASKFGIPSYWIAVELDGHAFHEKTKEQVALRNRRDRDLQAFGWKVFHFSGSEMYRNPIACVTEVAEYAMMAHQRLWTQVFDKKQAVTTTPPADAQ